MDKYKKRIIRLLLLGVIFGAGLFLRTYGLGEASLWIDEGFTLSQVRAIQDHDYPLLPSGKTEWKDVLLPYLLSPIFFQGDPAPFRAVSVLFGAASIILIYFAGKSLFNARVGVTASFFLAFSYWHVAWSRQIRSYELLVFFTLLSLLFVFRYRKAAKDRLLAGAFLSTVLATLSKASGWLAFPGLFAYLLWKRRLALAAVSAGLFAGLALWYRENLWRGLDLSLANYAPFYLLEYFWKGFGIVLIFALLGMYLGWRDDRKHAEHLTAVLFLFVPFLFFSFFTYVNQKRYLLSVTPILFLYASFFIHYFSSLFNKRKGLVLVSLVAFTVLVDQLTAKSFLFYPQKQFALEAYTPQPDFKGAYGFLREHTKEGSVLVSAYPFMDRLYLGKTGYALALSYTGKEGDWSVTESHREYYSGAPEILSIAHMKKLSIESDVYFLADEMAFGRMHARYASFIRDNADVVWENTAFPGSTISVYRIPQGAFLSEEDEGGEALDSGPVR
jgi:4-amino-4-deoxy-L-arabinose transferase-like glycosyltransferase